MNWRPATSRRGMRLDLDELLAAVAEDRNALVAPFEGYPVIEACPTVFPLLTALRGGTNRGRRCHGRSAHWPTGAAGPCLRARSLSARKANTEGSVNGGRMH